MMAILLAGGKGTRLRPFTTTIPKPLLPLGDLPIVEVVLRQLAIAGIRRVVVTLGHMAHLFAASIGNGSRFGLSIEYLTEETPLGTAGSLRLVGDPQEHMLVMNGDLLTTLNYLSLLQYHRSQGACATIAVHQRTVNIDYGVIERTPDGGLSRYIEKPQIPYLVSMGIYAISRSALAFIPPCEKYDMPQLMQALRDAGQRVSCYQSDCYWQDIGRFDDYERASTDFTIEPERFLQIDYAQ
jgi:NDP-sugar pyrophosphorylase family protein